MKLFGRALQGNDYPDYKELLEFAVKRGYVVHESCNTKEVKQFLQTEPDRKDFSETFYKSWEYVKNMSRYEQFLDQIIYYYTGFNPNNLVESELPKVLFENLKPILSITAEEACTKCEDMLASGIALAKDTILAIFDVFDKCKYDKLNINKIKNREARLIAFKRLNQLPTETNEFLRYLIYIVTEDTTLIKNKEMLNKITKSGKDVSALINSFGVSKLSSIYGRYKLIFMAFKHANKSNISCINKLTKKSKKSINKPKQIDSDYFQTLLSNKETLDEVKLSVKLAELNNYKKIALLETINMYLMLNHTYRVFSIRNSKIWVKLIELNIHPAIIRAIIVYYENSEIMINLNNEYSEQFKSTVGVRQGGVLSPRLFAIYIHDLISEINKMKIGIRIGNISIDIIGYADDILIISNLLINIQKMLQGNFCQVFFCIFGNIFVK